MDSFRHLMVRTDSARREDIVTDLGLGLVAEQGWSALTIRAVSLLMGCSRQAVQQWFGGQQDLRRVFATCFVSRWRAWVPVRLRAHGPAGLLPESDEVLVWCRVRQALLEQAHREDWIADLADFIVEEERAALAVLAGAGPDSPEVVSLHALLTGLPLARCPAVPALQAIDFFLLARKQEEIRPSSSPARVTPVT